MYFLLITTICAYLLFVVLLSFEGKKRELGFFRTFFISLVLTPVVGLFILYYSPRKTVFSHYVKVNKYYNGDRKEAKKALKTSTDDAWIKIKASDIGYA